MGEGGHILNKSIKKMSLSAVMGTDRMELTGKLLLSEGPTEEMLNLKSERQEVSATGGVAGKLSSRDNRAL